MCVCVCVWGGGGGGWGDALQSSRICSPLPSGYAVYIMLYTLGIIFCLTSLYSDAFLDSL